MKRIAFASHVALIKGKEYDGIGNVLIETFKDIPAEFYFVRNSMEGYLPSVVRKYSRDGTIEFESKLAVARKPAPLRYVTEIIAACFYFTFRKKVDVYVGVDPLNTLVAVLLKKIKRIDTCIFFTPDYSPKRFDNERMNRIYHAIDRFCVRNADEVWSVSTKIKAIRKNMGLSDKKNILVPNVPPTKFAHMRTNKHDKFSIITSGIVSDQLDFEGMIRAISMMKDEYPKLSFTIVGNGPEEAGLKQLSKELKVEKRIIFLGRQPLEKSLEAVSKAGIGMALYTGEWGFNAFGDSTKCRECFFFGVPVITTDSHSTVEETKKFRAGIIVDRNVESYMRAIKQILDNYANYSLGASKLGEAYMGTHKKEIERIVQD